MTGAPLSPALAGRVAALPAGPKLLGLMALATLLLLISSPEWLAAIAAAALALGLLTLGAGRLGAAFPLALVVSIAALSLFTLAFEGPRPAVAVVFRLAALVLLAHIVTRTTRASEVQDALVAALRPFEWLPFVSAEKAGLALALTLRSLPRLGGAVEELKEAREARGLSLSPVRLVIPLIARMLRDAREIAEAIDARSWDDGKPEK